LNECCVETHAEYDAATDSENKSAYCIGGRAKRSNKAEAWSDIIYLDFQRNEWYIEQVRNPTVYDEETRANKTPHIPRWNAASCSISAFTRRPKVSELVDPVNANGNWTIDTTKVTRSRADGSSYTDYKFEAAQEWNRAGYNTPCDRIFILGGRNKDGLVGKIDCYNLTTQYWETNWGYLKGVPETDASSEGGGCCETATNASLGRVKGFEDISATEWQRVLVNEYGEMLLQPDAVDKHIELFVSLALVKIISSDYELLSQIAELLANNESFIDTLLNNPALRDAIANALLNSPGFVGAIVGLLITNHVHTIIDGLVNEPNFHEAIATNSTLIDSLVSLLGGDTSFKTAIISTLTENTEFVDQVRTLVSQTIAGDTTFLSSVIEQITTNEEYLTQIVNSVVANESFLTSLSSNTVLITAVSETLLVSEVFKTGIVNEILTNETYLTQVVENLSSNATLITQVSQNTTLINSVIESITNNPTYLENIVNNIAGNDTFITKLAQNSLVTQTVITTVLSPQYFNQLVTSISESQTILNALSQNETFVTNIGTYMVSDDAFMTAIITSSAFLNALAAALNRITLTDQSGNVVSTKVGSALRVQNAGLRRFGFVQGADNQGERWANVAVGSDGTMSINGTELSRRIKADITNVSTANIAITSLDGNINAVREFQGTQVVFRLPMRVVDTEPILPEDGVFYFIRER
jgi:hypothetical protein